MQQKIKIKLMNSESVLPAKAHDSDACYDVVANRIERKSERLYICHLGFSTEMPHDIKGVIVPRSSQTKTDWAMLNSPGQVDPDYRNEWQVRFTYIGLGDELRFEKVHDGQSPFEPEFPFKEGDRVAQIYFEKINNVEFELVEKTSQTARGLGGFGSSGR